MSDEITADSREVCSNAGRAAVSADDSRWRSVLLVGLSVTSTLIVLAVLNVGRSLRPIADDYCLARWAGPGFGEAMTTVYATWSGDLVVTLSNILFVGLPLIELPWSLASLFPFALAGFLVALASTVLIWQASDPVWRSLGRYALATPVLMLTWWSYWWLPVRFGDPVSPFEGVDTDVNLAASVTFWQNINSAYVIVTALWVVAAVALWRVYDRPLRLMSFAWLSVGVLLGLSGPVLAVSLSTLAVVFAGIQWVRRRQWFVAARLAMVVVGALIGVAISHFAPGTQSRLDLLTDAPIQSMNGPVELIFDSVQAGTQAWIGLLVGWASLSVLLTSLLLAVLLGSRSGSGQTRSTWTLMVSGVVMLAVGWTALVVTAMAESFAYRAYWHLVLPAVFNFMGLLLIAWGVENLLRQRSGGAVPALAAGLGLGAIGFTLVSTADLTVAIRDRGEAWSRGVAPAGDIPDIDPSTYVYPCWTSLADFRPLPDRGPGTGVP